MKTSILLSICIVLISYNGFSQTTSTQSATDEKKPQVLCCLTKSKADSLRLGEGQIEFTRICNDALATNPRLVLKPDKQFLFYYNIVIDTNMVLNSVTGQSEMKIIVGSDELKGTYESDDAFKKLDLTVDNGTKYRYKIIAEGDKTIFQKQ